MSLFFHKQKPRYYVSIHDCPIGVFEAVLDKKEYHKLCFEGTMSEDQLHDIWIKIYSEFIKTFGLPETYERYVSLRLKWCSEQVRIWCKGQNYRESFAAIYKSEYESLLLDVKSEFHKAIAYVSKEMGFRVPPNETTVFEFYGYIKHLNNG